MKTRNQLNTKVVSEVSFVASHPEDASSESPSKRSSSPPCLRDRRSTTMEGKRIPPPNLNQISSPPVTIRRLSGPTRILPRRSCAPTSLLVSSNCTTTKQSTSKSSDISQISSRKDTNQGKQPAPSTAQVQKLDNDTSSAVNIKPANIENHSKDVPSTKNIVPSTSTKHQTKNSPDSDAGKTKLVRISLPNKANNPIDLTSHSEKVDKNMYMVTMNGLKKISHISSDKTITNCTSNQKTSAESSSGFIGQQSTNELIKKKVFKLLLGVTGSVATIKLVELTKKIVSKFPRIYVDITTGITMEAQINIKIVMTQNSKHFVSKDQIKAELVDSRIEIYDDSDEWSLWKKMGDPVLHIVLRNWADSCLIAPLDANTMGKLANGICDNLLTCIVRAWDLTKPLIYCPAMNTHMYSHPITREQLSKLQTYGYIRVDCIEKRLACGDVGIGAMASVDTIAEKVIDHLLQPVSQKVSLTKPLLNQQPTYPIMATSHDDDLLSKNPAQSSTIPTIRDSIFDRFKKNNQISIHAVPTSNSHSILNKTNELILKLKRKSHPDSHVDKNSSQPYILDEPSNSFSGNSDLKKYNYHINNEFRNKKNKMGGVTSVQNLKAIGVHSGTSRLEGESIDAGDHRFHFDPTRLLEQSMVTDDFMTVGDEFEDPSTDVQINSFKSLSHNGTSFDMKIDLEPSFNTSKFLTSCYNKSRGDFTCAICKHDYKNRKSMARHLKEQHVQGNIFQCEPCGVSYKRREKLIKHNREQHPGFNQ